jgi:8-oxo-dGTP pyrophosphatase MutT (NUDIX family)
MLEVGGLRDGFVGVLTRAHVFVERGGLILVLQQAGSWRWWECPGGDVEAGEVPADAAMREVFEETGLRIATPLLLREWKYENRHGNVVRAYAFAGRSGSGDVLLSEEHSGYAWMTAREYSDRYCRELPESAPAWVRGFLREMRENCRLFEAWADGRSVR